MSQYASLEQIPSYFQMVNPVKTSGQIKKDVRVNHRLLISLVVINPKHNGDQLNL